MVKSIHRITRDTLIPVSLVAGLIVAAYAVGADRQRINAGLLVNASDIVEIKQQLRDVQESLVRLELKFQTRP